MQNKNNNFSNNFNKTDITFENYAGIINNIEKIIKVEFNSLGMI